MMFKCKNCRVSFSFSKKDIIHRKEQGSQNYNMMEGLNKQGQFAGTNYQYDCMWHYYEVECKCCGQIQRLYMAEGTQLSSTKTRRVEG